jgi:hypothetical protein
MTDRPILFSAPMVRALLDGRKTQTRRVLGRLRYHGPITEFGRSTTSGFDWHFRDRQMSWHDVDQPHLANFLLPYRIGDQVWVREAWRGALSFDHLKPSELPRGAVQWEADGAKSFDDFAPGKLRPSIFMPRWASRITLIVTDVRVERIQDISAADAITEGLRECSTGLPKDEPPIWGIDNDAGQFDPAIAAHSPQLAFRSLWDSINARRGYGWDANPWVAALAFTVYPQNIDQMEQAHA